MLNSGFCFFIQIFDDSGEKTLHPAKIVKVGEECFTAASTHAAQDLMAGSEGLIFFECDGEFVQQSIRIDAVMPEGSQSEYDTSFVCELTEKDYSIAFGFQTIGEPVSAESRQTFRVSTVMANVSANLGDEYGCKVLDVSATGFSLLADQLHEHSTIIEVTLEYDRTQYCGEVRIQNIGQHHTGQYRYGLHLIEEAGGSKDLEDGLRHIGMNIQRLQLRRMTGSD